MANLLCTASAPAGKTKLSEWIMENSKTAGKHYSSELARRENREKTYDNLCLCPYTPTIRTKRADNLA